MSGERSEGGHRHMREAGEDALAGIRQQTCPLGQRRSTWLQMLTPEAQVRAEAWCKSTDLIPAA